MLGRGCVRGDDARFGTPTVALMESTQTMSVQQEPLVSVLRRL